MHASQVSSLHMICRTHHHHHHHAKGVSVEVCG